MSNNISEREQPAKMLPMEVIVDLAKKKDAGDVRARQELIVSHLWLVKKESIYFANKLNKLKLQDDLYQEACIGLIEAVDNYDWQKNVYLSTYATYWIRKRLKKYFPEKEAIIKIPEDIYYLCYRYQEFLRNFTALHGRKPTVKECAEEFGVSEKTIELLPRYYSVLISGTDKEDGFIIRIDDSSEDSIEDYIMSPENIINNIVGIDFSDYNIRLHPREDKVLRLKFGFDGGVTHTFNEIGKKLGISDELARKIYIVAMQKIKEAVEKSISEKSNNKFF